MNTRKLRRSRRIGNDNTAAIPQVWADYTLATLHNELVMARLVNRDYSDMVQNYGDTVNLSRPNKFVAINKNQADAVTIQDANLEAVPVKLNIHSHVTFPLYDEEISKGLPYLLTTHMLPAAKAIAEHIDRNLISTVAQFAHSVAGQLETMDKTNATDYIIAARRALTDAQCPDDGLRRLVVTTASEQQMLRNEQFIDADRVGDDGSAMRNASLGRKLGFDIFATQQTPFRERNALSDSVFTAELTTGYSAGAVTYAMDTQSAATTPIDGSFFTIAGNMRPQRIASSTVATPGVTGITATTGLSYSVVNNAQVRIYIPYVSDTGSTYPAGWSKKIHIDGFASGMQPKVGQLVAIGTGSNTNYYGIVGVDNIVGSDCDIQLDRPLVASLANDVYIFPLPVGSYNFAFHKNAVALVSRPLRQPAAYTQTAVASMDGIGLRYTMWYNGNNQQSLITFDCLSGTKVLDENLGAIMFG
jgi:hypothetical protein